MRSVNNSKKNKSKQRYFLSAYLVPIVFGFIICVIAYLLTTRYDLDKKDKFFGCFIGVISAFILHFKNRFKWLPLPNGSYIHKKELGIKSNETKPDKPTYNIKPTNYIESFYYSGVSKIINLICGILMSGAGIFIISNSSIIFPSLIIIGGIFWFYSGYKEIIDSSPKIKIAKEGLWTKELGFRPWSSINKTEIKVEKSTRSTNVYLEIYLKDSDIDFPSQRLQLNDIKDNDKIKPLIDELSMK